MSIGHLGVVSHIATSIGFCDWQSFCLRSNPLLTIPCLTFAPALVGISQAVQRYKPKMVFLTSPNNPDGSIIAPEDLQAIIQLPVLVVLDEAYVDFCLEPSRLRMVLDTPNLVVLRTFSKSAGLAGIASSWMGTSSQAYCCGHMHAPKHVYATTAFVLFLPDVAVHL